MKSWLNYFNPNRGNDKYSTNMSVITMQQLGQKKEAVLQGLLEDSLQNPFITVRYHLGRRATDPLTDKFESIALVDVDKFITSNRWEVRAENMWQQGVYTLVFGDNKLLDVLNTRSIFYATSDHEEALSYLRLKSQSDLYKPLYTHVIPPMLLSYQRQFAQKQTSEQTFLEVKLLKVLIESYCEIMRRPEYEQKWSKQVRAAVETHFNACIAANHVGRYSDEQIAKACNILQAF
ncbi:hypothetical protein [Pseudoalteromonas luteoviolacea]|uniref:hypothetical protein n=1 Tax=Pseudoalteromonas luteoviolacea TaxID=43657 RepID=UPI00114DA1A6|nr:hypothetical protein [Pseudoalteromonas luteoviolacea]TQF66778.1 hypothetical protein FLM44_24690 [Pseudoalteromonas luteoviolacea]